MRICSGATRIFTERGPSLSRDDDLSKAARPRDGDVWPELGNGADDGHSPTTNVCELHYKVNYRTVTVASECGLTLT